MTSTVDRAPGFPYSTPSSVPLDPHDSSTETLRGNSEILSKSRVHGHRMITSLNNDQTKVVKYRPLQHLHVIYSRKCRRSTYMEFAVKGEPRPMRSKLRTLPPWGTLHSFVVSIVTTGSAKRSRPHPNDSGPHSMPKFRAVGGQENDENGYACSALIAASAFQGGVYAHRRQCCIASCRKTKVATPPFPLRRSTHHTLPLVHREVIRRLSFQKYSVCSQGNLSTAVPTY